MKKKLLCALLFSIVILSCQKPKDFVELYGEISNPASDSITLTNNKGFKKSIIVSSEGIFSDTLKITEGRYTLNHGKEYATIYLKNGNKTSFTLDTEAFDESLKFKGDDADKSNVLVEFLLLRETYINDDLFDQDQDTFETNIDNFKTVFENLTSNYSSIESSYFKEEYELFDQIKDYYKRITDQRLAIQNELSEGNPSPVFEGYENYNGGTTALSDFKGKFVYIDVWATWCSPCKQEIPFLKEIEAKYHDRDIEFVSISIDDESSSGSMKKAKKAWKTMVDDKKLTGCQLIAPNGWKTDFIADYKINGIPRFILIDPKGKIVDADAPRPSSKKLIKLLEKLGV